MKVFKAVPLFILLSIMLIVAMASPVYATDLPDSTPTIEEINVYQNLLEMGDMLVLVYANLPYGTPPTDLVTETFIWQWIDTDNVTIFASTTGYAYNDNGYGYNIYSMYLSASNVTAYGIVPGTAYTIRLRGNPTAFASPPVYNYLISALDYNSAATIALAQEALASKIILLADDLNNKWGLTTTTSLLQEGEAGVFLSLLGSTYFRGAIYGVQAMAPAIFDVVIQAISLTPRVWSESYSDNLSTMYSGSWVDTARAAGAALFGTSYDLLTIILLMILCISLVISNIMLTTDHWAGLIDVALVAVIGARLGFYDMGFLILIAALCWFYISTRIWFVLIR